MTLPLPGTSYTASVVNIAGDIVPFSLELPKGTEPEANFLVTDREGTIRLVAELPKDGKKLTPRSAQAEEKLEHRKLAGVEQP